MDRTARVEEKWARPGPVGPAQCLLAVERKVCWRFFWSSSRHAGTRRFRQVQRGARGAVAAHGTARDRNGAPGSALHFKRTERSLVSSVAFAALVYSGLVARSPKSCTCASTELGAYLQITTTAHACRPGCTRVVTQGSSAAALGAFYSAGLARYLQFCHVSSCFRPVMQG